MKRWLRLIIWKWISSPIIRTVEWTNDDQAHFALFLTSPCGKKFFEFLRQQAAHTTFNAVYHTSVSAEEATAHARGYQDVLGLIIRLSRFPPDLESAEDELEPTPAQRQRTPIDGRAFGMSGNSAI